jgi:DNA-binding IclR family transcriptional regulator
MPGLRLTTHQAQRLWSLDAGTCQKLLRTLEEMQFLRRTRGGDYMLAGLQ